MKRGGFTLIELLVVIAIIAILAAILFPVFASAKAAAKRTASLSNGKNLSLGVLIYAQGANDVLPPGDSWWGKQNGGWGIGGAAWKTWSMMVQPHVKNTDIWNDPLTTKYTPNDESLTPMNASYGYNATWLDPVTQVNGNWIHATKSQSSLQSVAQTVLLTASSSQPESDLGNTAIWWWGAGSTTQKAKVDPPDCNSIPQLCFGNWGTGTFSDHYLTYENGNQTGGVGVRCNDGTIVVFADGHAARLAIGALAAGTNWRKGIAGGSVVMNDETKYLWDDK